MQEFVRNLIMFHFVNVVRSFVNYTIFRELCDRMRFEVDCAKSHHHVISEGLISGFIAQLVRVLHQQLEIMGSNPVEVINF